MKDQTTDKSLKTLVKIANKNPKLAALIKQASDTAFNCDLSKLGSTAFADSGNRKFPINTRESAVLSYMYASEQQADPIILTKIAEALDLFNVPAPDMEKVAAEAPTGAWLIPDKKRYPVNTKDEVKMASAYFDDYGYQLSANQRREYCGRLIKVAADFGMPSNNFSPLIKRYAGVVCIDTRKLAMEIENRAGLCEGDNLVNIKAGYQKLASHISKMPSVIYNNTGEFQKVATTLQYLDEESDLTEQYGVKIEDAYLATFNTEKLAEDTLTLMGKQIPCSALHRLSAQEYSDVLGSDFFKEVSDGGIINTQKFKVIADTLPLDMKSELLARLKQV